MDFKAFDLSAPTTFGNGTLRNSRACDLSMEGNTQLMLCMECGHSMIIAHTTNNHLTYLNPYSARNILCICTTPRRVWNYRWTIAGDKEIHNIRHFWWADNNLHVMLIWCSFSSRASPGGNSPLLLSTLMRQSIQAHHTWIDSFRLADR